MKNSVLIQYLTPEQLENLINTGIEKSLSLFKKDLINQDNNNDLLTRKETCEFLKIDSSTLWHWTNKGKVKAYGIANRRYYKRSELLENLNLLEK